MTDSWLNVLRLTVALTCATVVGCGGAQSRKVHFIERGQNYLAHENYDKARVEFRNALQIAPNDPEVRYQNGYVAEKLGAVAEAAQFYQGTIDAQSDHVAARAHLGRLLFTYGAYQQALDTVQPGLAKHPDDPSLLTVRAGARARLDKNDTGALEDAEKAYGLDSRNEDAVAVLAGLYVKEGRKDGARTVLQRGIAQIPDTVVLRLALSGLYLDARDNAKAEQLLKDLVALRPNEAAQRINLAHFYAALDRVDEADATLRHGLNTLPRDAQIRAGLIDFLLARRGAGAAERELNSMVAANPDDDDLRLELARLYATQKQPDKAQELYRAVVGRNHSTDAIQSAKDSLAEMRLVAGDTAGAEALIKEVLAANPRSNASLALRARIELVRGDPKSAIADLRSVLRDQPDSLATLRGLAAAHIANREPAVAEEVLRRAADAHPTDTAARLDLANLLNQVGKPDQARPVAETLVRREPGNAAFLETAFRTEVGTKDLAAAAKTATALQGAVPDKPLGYYFAGVASEEAGNVDAAASDYRKALEIAPEAREPLEALVRLYSREGKTGTALELLRTVAASQPHNPLPNTLAGELMLAQKKLPEAVSAFQAASAAAPQWLPPYRGLAQARLAQDDIDGAVKALRLAESKVHPADAAATDLAALLQRLSRRDEAVKAYQDALRLNPQSDLAANNLAMLLVSYRTDKESLDQALSLAGRFADSANPVYVDTLGWVRYKRGETASALPVLGKAVSLAPEAPVVRYHLAMAQLKSGQTETARSNLQQALKVGDQFEGAGDARTALASLQARPNSLGR